jgi:hypothetical protein
MALKSEKKCYTHTHTKVVIVSVGNKCPPRSAMHALTLSSCLMQPGEELCVTGTVQQTRYCRFVWRRGSRKCIPDLTAASLIRTRCEAVFDSEQSLHLITKTSLQFDCWKTDGVTSAGYNTTWPAWAVQQSQRYCVFIKPTALYWTANTNKYLILVAWLFNDSVRVSSVF